MGRRSPTDGGARRPLVWLSVVGVLWIGGMLALAHLAPDAYYAAMQEDRATEWWTVTLFLLAGGLLVPRVVRGRRWGDALVVLFCLVAAGEEVSWGQRLLGFMPPETFLARNAQQEANVHNLVEAFGQPKWSLIAILAAYGIVAPLAARLPRIAAVAARIRFTVPPRAALPWFAITCALLAWYPVRFTGEWAEALAGVCFVAAAGPRPRAAIAGLIAGAVVAVAMQEVSARPLAGGREAVPCAAAEAQALLDAVTSAPGADRLDAGLHRRVWTAVQDGDIDERVLEALVRVPCAPADASANDATRRRYAVDPWGTAYWIRTSREATGDRVTVYSFGPNRRRDTGPGDDVSVAAVLAVP